MRHVLSSTVLVFAMAFSGAAFAHSEWYGKEGQDEKESYMENALSKLPAKDAAEFRKTMKESREENKDLQEQVYRLHGDLHAILTAPNFDKHAFLAKRAQLQKLHEEMEDSRTEAFAFAISGLSQDERVTLTRALDHGKNHHRHSAQTQGNNEYSGEPSASIKH